MLHSYIDYTCLNPNASHDQIAKLVAEALKNNFHSVCIRPQWIKEFSPKYRCSAVIGFPSEPIYCANGEDLTQAKQIIGATPLAQKIMEARKALEDGALELDPVIEVRNFDNKNTNGKLIREELAAYINLIYKFAESICHSRAGGNPGALHEGIAFWIKPIFSCELLTDEEIELSIKIFAKEVLNFKTKFSDSNCCLKSSAEQQNQKVQIKFAYKNSTGFIKSANPENFPIALATPELIGKIAKYLDFYDPERIISIKAAGGIKTNEQAMKIYKAADGRLSHIGCSLQLGKLSNP